ncbi:MAG: epoxyqueuosine reductase QueH [bacterium]
MMENKKPLLLHVCCAPCFPHVFRVLSERYRVTAFFFNPNVQPPEEYARRRDELENFCAGEGIPFIEGARDSGSWLEAVRGLENEPEGGKRCEACFRYRLAGTARLSAEAGFKYFTTTLTVSPLKNAGVINAAGRDAAGRFGTEFLERDFKKKNGFKKSCEMSRKYGFYRQNYCGCAFSLKKNP